MKRRGKKGGAACAWVVRCWASGIKGRKERQVGASITVEVPRTLDAHGPSPSFCEKVVLPQNPGFVALFHLVVVLPKKNLYICGLWPVPQYNFLRTPWLRRSRFTKHLPSL
ncbi:hypothetical protein ARMGADRAFT_295828 [Armillaria gallica]|uniref:Uncharacterized protein n=1 Tax=Armillaria gallica TaxID=47427 RepID=A0A2H3D4Z1_ARMGA|nr:hypothetical protein ARMGADRAFT_295828 [Armillaria gallica]